MIDTAKDLEKAIFKSNQKVEITKSLYWFFLEVLPPKKIREDFFVFQEGCGESYYFSKFLDKYHCSLLSNTFCSVNYDVWVSIYRENERDLFTLVDVAFEESDFKLKYLRGFKGKKFKTPLEVSQAINISFLE